MPDKAIRQLLKEAEAEGWEVELAKKGGHYKLRHPSGETMVVLPSTPRNAWRTVKNVRAEMRRALRAAESLRSQPRGTAPPHQAAWSQEGRAGAGT